LVVDGDPPIGTQLVPPPYPADGKVHCWIPDGRALARCGYPDSQNVCTIATDGEFVLYPESDQCPTCATMLADGDPGPAEWAG